MSHYSNVEYAEMVRIYAKCNNNITLACKIYREEYGRSVSHKTMLNAIEKLPKGASKVKIWKERKVTKRDATYSQHKKVAIKKELDMPSRIIFCDWILENSKRNILWTNETVLNTAASNHPNNVYFWAQDEEIPHLLEKFSQQKYTPKPHYNLTVWGGIIGNIILGPVFFDKVNGDKYYDFLTTKLPKLLEDVPLIFVKDMYFQHDGCAPHCVERVNDYLNYEFEDRWIGKEGPIQWPAASKDLNPVHFFLWNEVKRHIHKKNPYNNTDLKETVLEAFTLIRKTKAANKINAKIKEKAMQCLKKWQRH